VRHSILGTTMPVLEIQLDAEEAIVAEPGEFSWMSVNIALSTTTQTAGARGLFSILGRALAGGGLFMTEYRATGGEGLVAFTAKVPGSIHEVQLAAGQSYYIHKHGFLCATEGVQLAIGFQQRLGAGLFGGNGFIMQRVTGPGTAFVELGGESVFYELAAGQSLMVHPGHVGMFEESVNFEVQFIRGIRNALFGGDGLFMVCLTGPGRVWLQSMTVPNLAHAIEPYLVQDSNSSAATGGVAGAIVNGLLRDR
jgi:uncharacterized protein (TIGR00266 family)